MVVIVFRAADASHETITSAVSLGMIAMALASMLQALRLGPIGSGMLAPSIFSAIYLGPSVLAARSGGLPAVFGLTIFAGAVEVLIESEDLKKRYGSKHVAVTFRFGKGRVFHMLGHFFQKEGNLRGAFSAQRLIANFLIAAVRRK